MKSHLRYTAVLVLCALFACRAELTERRTDFVVHGVDVSRYQGDIRWEELRYDDLTFAYIKATEGSDHQDARFAENWASASQQQVVRGAYHFFRPKIDARAQAEHFTAAVKLEVGDLPPVLDVEVLDEATRTELISGMRTWLYLTEIRTGVRPIIYTNLGFYYRHLAGHFDDYRFWIARYGSREPSLATGAQLTFWQYGDRGRAAGIDGPVDLNVFFGTRAEFDALRIQEPQVLTWETEW